MAWQRGYLVLLAIVALLGGGLVGCGRPAVDPKLLAELRGKYLLSAEPADIAGVIDLREEYKEPTDVAVLGLVGGVPNPWTRGQASFVISDASLAAVDDDEAHHKHEGHDPATCPFCSKKHDPMKTLALVQFVDDAGKVVPVDARDLFGIVDQQMIIVRGRAEQDATGHLVVRANGLFIRK